MDANTKGNLFAKRDRIVDRIYDASKIFLNQVGENITREEFKDFLISVRLIVNSELTEKGVERKWKA